MFRSRYESSPAGEDVSVPFVCPYSRTHFVSGVCDMQCEVARAKALSAVFAAKMLSLVAVT